MAGLQIDQDDFLVRQRTRSFRDVAKGMSRTHLLGVDDTIAAAVFPAATLARPITFHTEIEITGAAAEGVIFEFGNSTTGIKCWLEGGDTLAVAAGDGTTSSNTGADAAVVIDAIADGSRFDIVVAANPGAGALRLWADGQLIIRETSSQPWTSNTWAAAADGSVGQAENGTSNSRSTVDITTAPNDFAVVRSLEAFVGQLPRFFNENIRSFA